MAQARVRRATRAAAEGERSALAKNFDSLELKLKSSQPFPQAEIVNQINTDILSNSTGAT
jgi:hypothetical protein